MGHLSAATTQTSRRAHSVCCSRICRTHTMLTQWPLPPSVEVCEQIIDTWAVLHAFWWRHPRLGRDIGTFTDDAAIAKGAADTRERYARFAEFLGDRLWPRAREIYRRV